MYATQPQTNTSDAASLVLAGNCGYDIQSDRVIINIAEIANRRDYEDLSGTLAIEFWALKQPPAADHLDGLLLAATTIGELSGQHFLSDCRYDLIFQEPPAGNWQLTLMLREWTTAGYVTRDQVNFALPYVVSGRPPIVRSETDNVINVNFSAHKDSPTKAAASAASVASNPSGSETRTAVSLNQASLNDIEAVKGVSKKLAENIIATRPFTSFDDVLKVKGMGAKLLQKIRDYITL